MSNLTTIVCDLHAMASETSDPKTRNQLLTLWLNVGRIKRAEEVIRVGGIHLPETIENSRQELSKLSSAKTLCENLILDV